MTLLRAVLTTLLLTLGLAVPAAAAPQAQSSLLGGVNDLLSGTTGALLDTSGDLVAQIDPTTGVITDLTGEVIGTINTTTGQIYDTTGTLFGTVDATTGHLLDGETGTTIIGGVVPTGPSGGPGTPGGTGTAGGAFGTSSLNMALSASRAQRLVTVARRGVRASTSCSAACGVLAAVTVDGRTARRLRLSRGTQHVVLGTASAGAGSLPVRISSRARRALSAALPTSRTRKKIRSKRIRAQRASRSRTASLAQRRKARRSYLRYRKIERRWISSGRVKLIVHAVGMEPNGRTTTIHRRSLVVKR